MIWPLSNLCDSTAKLAPGAIPIGCAVSGSTCDDGCALSIAIEPTNTGTNCGEIF